MGDHELERLRFWQMVFAASLPTYKASIDREILTCAAIDADDAVKLWDDRFGPEHTKTV